MENYLWVGNSQYGEKSIMKKYKNVIFLSSQPLIGHIRNTIYFDDLVNAGFHVEFWCFRKLCNYKYYLPNELKEEFRDFSSKRKLREELGKFSAEDTFVFLESIHTIRAYRVVRMFRDFDLGRLVLYNTFPYEQSYYDHLKRSRSVWQKICDIWRQRRIDKRIAESLFARNVRIALTFCPGCPPGQSLPADRVPLNYIFTGGGDIPEEWRGKPYCLYIEQGFPYHPDLAFHGVDTRGNRFLEYTNAFFRKIEDEYKIPVVIAAHPKSPMKSEDYEGRPFLRGCLEGLIDHAEYVTGHESNAFNYAIIRHKKIALFHDSFLRDKVVHTAWRADKLGSLIGANVYDSENPPEHIEFKCDPEKCDLYSRTYLIGNPGYGNAEIIIRTLSGEKVEPPGPEARTNFERL